MKISACYLLSIFCIVGTAISAETEMPMTIVVRHPLHEVTATYHANSNSLMGLVGRMGAALAGDAELSVQIVPAENGRYEFICEITTSKRTVPGIGEPIKTTLWKCVTMMEANGSVITETISEGKTASLLTVTTEESPMLGVNKVIRTSENGKTEKELLVGKDDIITTLFQVIAFAGTLSDLSDDGMRVRWVLNGSPNPMVLKKIVDAPRSYSLSKDNLDDSGAGELPLFRLVFPETNESFALPTKIALLISGQEFEFDKKGE